MMARLTCLCAALAFAGAATAGTARAQTATVPHERDIGDLRLGQRVMVDDGTCPSGQIKEVTGASLTAAGVARAVKCVPRPGSRR